MPSGGPFFVIMYYKCTLIPSHDIS
jgi:hypothetical protein